MRLTRPGNGDPLSLQAGQMTWLRGDEPYALGAAEDSVLLMTIVRLPE